MAQQYKQLGLKFTVAGTTFFADPSTDRRSVLDRLRPHPGADRRAARTRRRSSRRSTASTWSSSPAVLQRRADRADRRSTRCWPRTSPSPARTCTTRCSRFGKFQGLIPLKFKTNTATVPIDINEMQDGKDVTLKQMQAAIATAPHARAATAGQRPRHRLRARRGRRSASRWSTPRRRSSTSPMPASIRWAAIWPGRWSTHGVPLLVALAARDRRLHRARRADPEPALRAAGTAAARPIWSC